MNIGQGYEDQVIYQNAYYKQFKGFEWLFSQASLEKQIAILIMTKVGDKYVSTTGEMTRSITAKYTAEVLETSIGW